MVKRVFRLAIAVIQVAALVVILVAAYQMLERPAFSAVAAAVVLAVTLYVENIIGYSENGDDA